MLRWTLALVLGLIIACAGGDGGEGGPPRPPGSTTEQSDAQTSEDQKPGAPQLTPKIGTLAGSTPTVATESPSGPVVTLGGVPFRVELAITSEQRIKGLSGQPPLASGTGMLFVFEQAIKYSFWMRGMLFPLDMIWIDVECTVVHITRNAPPPTPEQALADLPRYGPPVPVLYVLEINAGGAESASVTVGRPAQFTGSLTGRYGC